MSSAAATRDTVRGKTHYEIRDREGVVRAVHVRLDGPNGKKVWWNLPDGTSGLNGTPLGDLPLYGSEYVDTWPVDRPVVLCEGEKAAQALLDAGYPALGTVTGAAGTPGREALTVLEDRDVTLWPDADEPGRKHMDRIGRELRGMAASVQLYDWPEAAGGDDAADHPAVFSDSEKLRGRLLNDLLGAPVWEDPGLDVPIRLRDNGYESPAKPQHRDSPPTHPELRDRWIASHPERAFGLGGWRAYAKGVWAPESETAVEREIDEILVTAQDEGLRSTASVLSSVVKLARVKTFVADEQWDADADIIVCKNGTLHIPTGELRSHDKSDYATSGVPYNFDSEATAPAWQRLLLTTVPDAWEFLQEFAGYVLTTDTKHEIALWLAGPPGSGKSTVLAGLQAMLGERAGTLGLADIERNRFALASVPGKTLLVATEQPSSYLTASDVLNTLISGEPVQVERKYQDAYTIIPRAKIAWAMNELPRVPGSDNGLFRRVKVLQFPARSAADRDPDLKRRVELEGAGILNWALEGLYRLRERGYFEIPDCMQEATEEFRKTNDVPGLFVEECCIPDPREGAGAQKLYDAYKWWCEDNGHKPQSSTSIAKDWQRLGFKRARSGGRTTYEGFRLRLPSE